MALTENLDPDLFFQPLLVFTSARVEAKWGTTGKAHCIRDEKLLDYITNKKFGNKLTTSDVTTVAQAFLALA